MRSILPTVLLGLSFLFALRSVAQEAEYVPGHIMMMIAPGASPEAIAADLRDHQGIATGLRVDHEVSKPMRTWLLKFDHERIAQHEMLKAVRAHRDVQIAQNDHIVKERIVPNDTQYGQQWHHQNIDSEEAWDLTTGGITATGDTIVVCIIENSDLPHPDLIANAWFNHNEIPNNGIDDDDNGYVDDYRGWNTPGNDDDVYGGSHGTQVAGMIGATGDNNLGVAGANWNVKMMVVDYGGVQESSVVSAYTYPLVMRRLYNETNGVRGAFVVATNASWGIDGGQPSNSPLWCAIYDTLGTAGVLNCGATSNSNVNIDVVGDLPTACPSDHLISVTATNSNDMRTFSAYGAVHVDLGAPGEDVRTTSIGGGYGTTSGTSFASPLTAGVIGLLYSAPCASMMTLVHGDPSAGALFVRDALFDGVDQVGNLGGQTVTGGRINVANSLNLIMANCGSCPAPYGLATIVNDISSADLTWNSVSGTLFDVRYRVEGAADWTVVNGIDGTSLTVNGLLPCTPYEFQVSAGCDGENSDWSTSFSFLSEGCCTSPGSGLIVTDVTDSTATITWAAVLAAEDHSFRYRELGTSTWTTINAITGTQHEITGLEACTTYELQGQSNCTDSVSTWSPSIEFNVTGCGACVDHAYCPAVSDDSSDEHIANVTIGTINNNSGNDGGYANFTHMTTDLTIGGDYTISLTPGYSGWTFSEHFRVWIDLDQDGDFDGPGELVYDAPQTTSNTITGTITIPLTATEGPTRMRVIMQYNAPVTGPCADGYDYGETEDYCVTLMPLGTSIHENASVHFNVYPDPADQLVNFVVEGAIESDGASLLVMDNTGRIITREAISSGRATVSTAMFANGMYFYRIVAGDREIHRGKFIVAH